jgi:hypothetical protein
MNLQELKERQKELKDQMQNEFIERLLDNIEHLVEKANRKDYEPTEHERVTFNKIYNIIVNMSKWF